MYPCSQMNLALEEKYKEMHEGEGKFRHKPTRKSVEPHLNHTFLLFSFSITHQTSWLGIGGIEGP